jgi:hypothetical protein
MKRIVGSKRSCTTGLCKTAALAATLAMAMFASAAQADVIVTDVLRATTADNGILPALSDTSTDLGGVYNKTLTRSTFLDEGSVNAIATQNTNITEQVFSGTGTTSIEQPAGQTVEASSDFRVFFKLTESYLVSGLINFTSVFSRLGGFANVGFDLFDQGNGNNVFHADRANPLLSFSGTLTAGDYLLDLFTLAADGADGNAGFASTSFDLLFALTAIDDVPPPINVPEPGLLALLSAGLMAESVSRRKRSSVR